MKRNCDVITSRLRVLEKIKYSLPYSTLQHLVACSGGLPPNRQDIKGEGRLCTPGYADQTSLEVRTLASMGKQGCRSCFLVEFPQVCSERSGSPHEASCVYACHQAGEFPVAEPHAFPGVHCMLDKATCMYPGWISRPCGTTVESANKSVPPEMPMREIEAHQQTLATKIHDPRREDCPSHGKHALSNAPCVRREAAGGHHERLSWSGSSCR